METHGQIYGKRATTRLLPGSNQEHLGRVSPERPAGGGLLLGLRNPYRDRETLPRGLLGVQGGSGSLAEREGVRMVGFSGHLGQGGVSAPADRIRSPVEVPTTGVGLRETCNPGHRDGLPGSRGCATGHLPPVNLSGAMEQIPRRDITGLPAKQAGIALTDSTRTAGANWTVSCVITGHLVVTLCGTAEFR